MQKHFIKHFKPHIATSCTVVFTTTLSVRLTAFGTYNCAINDHGNADFTWHNTTVVTCASNCTAGLPESSVLRWSKTEKKKIDIPMSNALKQYNQKMAVHLFDKFVATYRVRIQSKKLWWPFFDGV